MIDAVVTKTINPRETEREMNIHRWEWDTGVGLYGVFRAWETTKNSEYLDFIKGWVEEHLLEVYKVKCVNGIAPLITVIDLYKVTKEEKYLKVCEDIGNWVIGQAPKTREGGLEHTVTDAEGLFKEQIWADTIFMAAIFLAKMGSITGNEIYTQEAINQLIIHHEALKDKNTGLFYHAWNCESRDWMSGALWGRANAWMTVSTVEMLELLPDSFEGKEYIIKSLQEQIQALQKVQTDKGMFYTVLDQSSYYEETSATAGIAYGIKRGIKKGYISQEYHEIWQKAEKSLLAQIADNGDVKGVSSGTPVMEAIHRYNDIPVRPMLYGQALMLLFLCE